MCKSRSRRPRLESLSQRVMLTGNVELLVDINPDTGVSSLVEVDTGFAAFEFVEHDGYFYFAANDGISGSELWRSDGTEEGTELVADINKALPEDPLSTQDTAGSLPTGMVVYKNEIYFAAISEDGDELWKTDGTEEGTVQVKDIWEGEESSIPEGMTIFNDKLYFLASTEEEGGELWMSDGTEDGTELVADIYIGELNSNAGEFYVFQDELYFSAIPTDEEGPELWKTDGTEDGTELVRNINEVGLAGSFPESFFEFKGELYFIAADGFLPDGSLSSHIFKTDGTEEGTVRVFDENITTNLIFEPNVVEFKDHLYYGGRGDVGWELFRTDGTPGESELVVDLQGAFSFFPSEFMVYQDQLYMAGSDELGRQVWRSNGEVGEANETVRLTAIENGQFGIFPSEMFLFNDQLFFNGTDGDNFRVWTTNDQGETFEPITTEFENNTFSNEYSLFFEFDGRLFFRGSNDEDTGLELWSYTPSDEPPELLDGDVDGDGDVDFTDFLALSLNFGNDVESRADGDLNGDKTVDFNDFLILSSNFGRELEAAFAEWDV